MDLLSKEAAKQRVQGIVEKFQRVMDESKLKDYSEERTKNEFIEPLFEVLGWDMRNERTDDEVIKEQRVLRGRADYAFRVGGVIRFFVEAKGAKANLSDPEFAKQVISYGVNKGVTWAVLTDFEGLKVFNCEWNEQNIWRNQVFELRYTQFLGEFDKLWLLSKEAFDKNALADYATTIGKRTPRKSVSELLLTELLVWREALSKDIKKVHPDKYSLEEIDEIVQRLIDRLIFIRACEDRQIEGNKLKEAVNAHREKGKGLSRELKEIFGYYREHYDSKLFGRTADEEHEADKIKITDNILDGVIDALYYSKDGNVRYDFALIDSDVLGNVYEQYLGTVLQTTAKRAKLSEGKTHRKEQGIYYTPTHIVDYIVKNTLGELIKKKKPVEVDKIRVLDPACGSGSFLIKAFDILDDYYAKHDKQYAQSKLGSDGARITKKIEILKNNIHGVDLDEKAVEIAKLNLLLKMAEKRHLLPSLEDSIKCGNSLIDDSKVAGDKAFDWNQEFEEVMKDGGFDVVIGNPPYIRVQTTNSKEKEYLSNKYLGARGKYDIYILFIERSLNLLKPGGLFSFIVPNKFTQTKYGEALKKYILENYSIEQYVDFGDLRVFEEATTYPCIIVIKKEKPGRKKSNYVKVKKLYPGIMDEVSKKRGATYSNADACTCFNFRQNDLNEENWAFMPEETREVYDKLVNSSKTRLCDITEKIVQGFITGDNSSFIFKPEDQPPIELSLLKPIPKGKNVQKYAINDEGYNVLYTNLEDKRPIPFSQLQKYPKTLSYLKNKASQLKKRKFFGKEMSEFEEWWQLVHPIDTRYFEKPKIITPNLSPENRFALDEEGYFVEHDCYIITLKKEDLNDYKYLLALLNSKPVEFFFKQTSPMFSGGYYKYHTQYLNKIPIPQVSDNKKSASVQLVDNMRNLKKKLISFGDKKTDARARLEKEIAETDAKIDELVYGVYNLTEEERKIVEKTLNSAGSQRSD